jgi:hypothetical protein
MFTPRCIAAGLIGMAMAAAAMSVSPGWLGTARAADNAPAKAAPDPLSGEPPPADPARHLETPNLVTPIVRQGQLRNYIYVTVRVLTPDGVDARSLRERGHFLRDALLRASHENDLAAATRDDQLNIPRATVIFTQAAKAVLGEGAVKEVQLLFINSLRRTPAARRAT